jgi:outer membrane protein assembly factor BamA
LQGNITDKSLRWLGGVGIMNFNVGSASTTRAWDTSFVDQTTLYDDFVDLGAITATEADGGLVTYIKGGVVYDTRDNEACPMKGLWEELLMTYAPKFLGEGGGWLQLSAIHRQYFTLVPDKLSLTYRL